MLRATHFHSLTHSVNFTQTQTVFSIVESKQDVSVLRSGPSRTNKHTEAEQVLKGSLGFDPPLKGPLIPAVSSSHSRPMCTHAWLHIETTLG